jgi:ABC-type dipeptide/oligopeptide/nickel transport system permease component
METSQIPPRLLPLRLILLSALVSLAILAWQGVPTSEWMRLLVGLTQVSSGGTTLANALFERCTLTLGLVIGAACLSQALSLATCFVSFRLGFGLPSAVRFVGRFFALFPIVAVSWLAVGWIVGVQGLPVESLIPHHPVPGQDTASLSLGRLLWWRLLPIWLLSLPMTGDLVAETIPSFLQARECDLAKGLRARGASFSVIRYRHWLPLVWPSVTRLLLSRGLLLFGYAVFVEEALGIQGWGSFFAHSIANGQVQNIAGAIYAAGWMSAAWCLCVTAFKRITFHSFQVQVPELSKLEHSSPHGIAASAGCVLLLLCFAFSGGPVGSILSELVSPLVHDLGILSAASLLALIVAFALGNVLAFLNVRHLGFPKTKIMITMGWAPLFIYLLGISPFLKQGETLWIALGIGVGISGAQYLYGRWEELTSLPHVEAAYSLGASRLNAWKLHVMPDMFFTTLSWTLKTFSTLLVWLVLIDGISPSSSSGSPATLGAAIWRAKINVLVDPFPLLVAGLLVGILALFFAQLSRILLPTSTHHH